VLNTAAVAMGEEMGVVHSSRSAYSIHGSSPFKRAFMLCSGSPVCSKSKSWTDVMILKIFSPKKWRFLFEILLIFVKFGS
jgi:hypothetical protein